MKNELKKRLERLEHILIVESFIVVFADGHREKVPPGECILLLKNEDIKDIAEIKGISSKENGLLVDLLNGLLEDKEREVL